MPTLKIKEDLASIVLLGKFNPAIFQPFWMASKGLLREVEAEAAKIEVILPELAKFRTGWMEVVVTADRFVAVTHDPAMQPMLRDLVVGLFELLEHTPTTHLGLNRSLSVDLLDEDRWHRLGHKLAPKEPWNDLLQKPGLRNLQIEGTRPDQRPGRVIVRIEPSQKYPHAAFIEHTTELQRAAGELSGTSVFVEALRNEWTAAMAEARSVAERLIMPMLEGSP